MNYQGDIRLGNTIDVKFTTVNTSGVPTTLAGSPVISAYVGNGTTEITAGITLSVDFDSRTGMHNVRVVATSGNGFATATDVNLVITTGTVSGSSVVGYVVGSFSIENRSFALNDIADAILKRDMSAVTGESARSPLNALRFLRNKWSLASGTLTVTKEDDSTSAWTAAISTDAAAIPIIGSDPA